MTARRFRKKPVEVEAVQYDGTVGSYLEIRHWSGKAFRYNDERTLTVRTPEGVMFPLPGDWIVREATGEFRRCKPDIFAATHEPADGAR